MVHSIKFLVCLIIFVSLIFAEGVNFDSLHGDTNPMKRQKLFFASENNLKFPPNEECVGLGCCVIPLSGCMMIGHNIFAKDTPKKDTTQVNKSKWGFGIGYSGGVCYTGEDLVKYQGDWIFDPIELILLWLYWLNSLEASIYYPVNQKSVLELGLSYGWTHLSDRSGWGNSFDPPDTLYLYANVGGGVDCDLKKININIGCLNRVSGLIYGIELSGSRLRTVESLHYYKKTKAGGEWMTVESANVNHICAGGGFYFGLTTRSFQRIFYFVKAKIAVDSEVTSDSPFKWTGAHKRIDLIFSGLYAGIKIYLGGKK